MVIDEFLKLLKKLIEQFAPAIAVILWDYEESKIIQAKDEALDAGVKLEEEKNNESVENNYRDSSDLDVLDDALKSGSGQRGDATSKNQKPSGSNDH